MGMKGIRTRAHGGHGVKRHADAKGKLELAPEPRGDLEPLYPSDETTGPPRHQTPGSRRNGQASHPERIDRMSALRKERMDAMNAAMDQRDEAIKTFYAALNPEQKKTFRCLEHARMGQQHARRQGMQHRMGRRRKVHLANPDHNRPCPQLAGASLEADFA